MCQTRVIFHILALVKWEVLLPGMDAGLDYIFVMTMQFNVQPVTVHV